MHVKKRQQDKIATATHLQWGQVLVRIPLCFPKNVYHPVTYMLRHFDKTIRWCIW